MRKETSSGLIAGAVSASLVGLLFAVAILFTVGPGFESTFKENPILAPNAHALYLAISAFMVLMYVALAAFLGGIAGLIFVFATNRLPIRSTYIKAIIPIPILWLVYLLVFARSLHSLLSAFTHSLEGTGVIVLCALLFAYLFNRWTKT
jgi:type II secretory pathway component PulF